jgi:phage-related protein
MPEAQIRIFRDEDGSVPFLEWLAELEVRNRHVFEKCLYVLDLLRQSGNELRRPIADYLRDGVYELRARVKRVNYRILYGFVGSNIVLVSHGFTKEKRVPKVEIERAIERLSLYQKDRDRYSVEARPDDGEENDT